MNELDSRAPNYRRAQERWPDAPALTRHYDALYACYLNGPHGLVEHVKSFVEIVCHTILRDYNKNVATSTPTTTQLLVAALEPLGLQNTGEASNLNKVLSSFSKLTDALSDMRNEFGIVAHGKDGFLDGVTLDHARTFLYVGDSILSVLLNAAEMKSPDLSSTRLPYDKLNHYHTKIDERVRVATRVDDDSDHPVVVLSLGTDFEDQGFEYRISLSRLLYGADRTAYVEALKLAENAPQEPTEPAEVATVHIPDLPSGLVASDPDHPATIVELRPRYHGYLSDLRSGILEVVVREGLAETEDLLDQSDLVESILATVDENLAVDWKVRPVLQARLRVGLRRVLIRFSVDRQRVDSVAERIVVWLMAHAPDRPPLD